MNAFYPALVVLLPALLGPLPAEKDRISFAPCGSDEVVTIEIPREAPRPAKDAPCHAKACHAACNRKQFDPAQ